MLGQTLGDSGVSRAPSLTSTDTAASPVGTYTIAAGLGSLAAENYTFSFVNRALSVTPATLTVTALSVSRAYGAADPAFTASYSGFVLGQTLGDSGVSGAPSLSSSDSSASPVGTYAITPAQGTLGKNYAFSFANGIVTVTPAATATALSVFPTSNTYGQSETLTAVVGAERRADRHSNVLGRHERSGHGNPQQWNCGDYCQFTARGH